MKKLLLKIGVFWASLGLTLAAVIISVLVTFIVLDLSGEEFSRTSLIASTGAPAVITPFFSTVILRLLFELDEAEKKYKELAATDDLTGIKNRRSFSDFVERELAIAKRYGTEFTLVLFDINNFKEINDLYGHLVGDQVLKKVAQTCQQEIRKTDVLARLGGDEFVILVPQSENLDINRYMQRLIQAIEKIEVNKQNPEVRISASIGAKRYTQDINTIEEIYNLADREMYLSKNS